MSPPIALSSVSHLADRGDGLQDYVGHGCGCETIMGADAFAERARHELLATGEMVRSRGTISPSRRSRSPGAPATD
jgi:hypothetical protein